MAIWAKRDKQIAADRDHERRERTPSVRPARHQHRDGEHHEVAELFDRVHHSRSFEATVGDESRSERPADEPAETRDRNRPGVETRHESVVDRVGDQIHHERHCDEVDGDEVEGRDARSRRERHADVEHPENEDGAREPLERPTARHHDHEVAQSGTGEGGDGREVE